MNIKNFVNYLGRNSRIVFAVAMFVGVFLFWFVRYPHALSYQEQNQLFLFTADYLVSDVSKMGGLAAYLGEFIVQFYYVEWLGAAMLALVYVLLYVLLSRVMKPSLALVPCVLMLWHYGDENVLLAYMMAAILALAAYLAMKKMPVYSDVVVVPALFWLAGPMAWLYVVLRSIRQKLYFGLALAAYSALVAAVIAFVVLLQYPVQSAFFGIGYYAVPMTYPELQFVIPLAVVLLSLASEKLQNVRYLDYAAILSAVVLSFCADKIGFDKEKYEVLKLDYQVRNERWNDIISLSENHQMQNNYGSVCVNLALAKTGQLPYRMFTFYQSGPDALAMGFVRDNLTCIPTMEVFYHLGMVNECMRYAFDIQESILTGKSSGRMTKRIAECCLANGWNDVAQKHLGMLRHSLFYRDWAEKAAVSPHLKAFRYKDDFLYNYNEIDKMFGMLFQSNPKNKMALEYFLGQMLLNCDAQGFMQYLGWAGQYGGYREMPEGYADAVRCIQQRGNVRYSNYADYLHSFMQRAQEMGVNINENNSVH